MFTQEQMETYDNIRSGKMDGTETIPADAEWQPPRTQNISDFPMLAARAIPEFGDGDMLLVGYLDPDLADCECGQDHVIYVPIRADGMIGDVLTSGTFGETSAATGMNPIMLLLGGPENVDVDEYLIPTWDSAHEVTPNEWPAVEVKTDMQAYEF